MIDRGTHRTQLIRMTPPRILISAGEASSDMYAARLATALRERTGAQLFGMGGPRMAEAGVELIADYHEVAVVGISEVLHKIPSVVRVQRKLARGSLSPRAPLSRYSWTRRVLIWALLVA